MAQTAIKERDLDREAQRAAIAQQNDAFRKGPIADKEIGYWMISKGVREKGTDFVIDCIRAVSAYDDFTEDNDPAGIHDMGFFEVDGVKVWWKIDLYDLQYEMGAAEPWNPLTTRRVLTILLPIEY